MPRRDMFPVVVAALLLVAAVVLVGCKAEEPVKKPAETAQYVNALCPMMGGPIDAAKVTADLTRDFQGKKVAFCCPACPKKWDTLTDDARSAALAEIDVKLPPKPEAKPE